MQQRFHAWLLEQWEETVLRWIFRSAVLVALSVLAVDLASINGWIIYPDPAVAPVEIREDSPALNLPRLVPSIFGPLLPDGGKHLVPLPLPEGALAKPMTFELVGGGRLMASGTITPGVSQSFAVEAERHGEYIRTVVLNSPGGSVTDALAMGRLIREKRFATEVEAGKYCVSSCPLVFAGGVDRRAGEKATIGVHQMTVMRPASNGPPRDEMSVAQDISARCQRYPAAANCHTSTTTRFASASICPAPVNGTATCESTRRSCRGQRHGSTISKSGLIPMTGRAAANIPILEKPKPTIAERGGGFADDFWSSSLNATAFVGRQS